MKSYLLLLLILMPGLNACAKGNPVEIGTVQWQRDFDQALADAKKSDKPVFLLFQEVPGCAGCKQFGKDVLSDPRLVAIIESEFVPVLIRNNVGGEEAKILKQYGEPAWNFQVVRFLDENGKDIIPRKDRVWETIPLAKRMQAALLAAGKTAPDALINIITGQAAPREEAVFAMYCFWTGEAKLGAIDGVLTTEAGFYDGREVTRVHYDPTQVSTKELIKKADRLGCAERTYLPASTQSKDIAQKLPVFDLKAYRIAPHSDQKKQLSGTPLQHLDYTPEQATKINAWVRRDFKKALSFLTPEQRRALGLKN